jgi:hypothetical protein
MDGVITLAETVRAVMKTYATEGYNSQGQLSRYYFVENREEQVFSVIGPYDPVYKQARLVLMVRIVGEKVIIDQDKTSVSLRDELKRAGIEETRIRLAWL